MIKRHLLLRLEEATPETRPAEVDEELRCLLSIVSRW